MARENIGSTGFGRNIAYPHCRMAAIDKPVVAILTLQDLVDYAAFDKGKWIVFLRWYPRNSAMASICRLWPLCRALAGMNAL